MFGDLVYSWLDNALDIGLTELQFWDMTIAELTRYFESRKRIIEREDQRQATFDYILADLIGRSVARIHNSSNKLPTLSEAYPSLFNSIEEAETIQQKKDELSALRFKQFALFHNKKMGVNKADE